MSSAAQEYQRQVQPRGALIAGFGNLRPDVAPVRVVRIARAVGRVAFVILPEPVAAKVRRLPAAQFTPYGADYLSILHPLRQRIAPSVLRALTGKLRLDGQGLRLLDAIGDGDIAYGVAHAVFQAHCAAAVRAGGHHSFAVFGEDVLIGVGKEAEHCRAVFVYARGAVPGEASRGVAQDVRGLRRTGSNGRGREQRQRREQRGRPPGRCFCPSHARVSLSA